MVGPTVVDEIDEIDEVDGVVVGESAESVAQLTAKSARTEMVTRFRIGNMAHPSLESYHSDWGRRPDSSLDGLYSCGTVPDSNRTSLLRSGRPQRCVVR